METRRLVILWALLGALIASGTSAPAEEAKLTRLNTAISNTTISGYIEVAVTFQAPRTARIEHESWWRSFLIWSRFQAR